METRTKNDEYKKIAERLIDTEENLEYIKDSAVRIVYLESDYQKKHGDKFVCGECEKIPAKYQWAINADFSVTLYSPNIIDFDERQMEALIYHELLHIGINESGNFKINPHDIEDFDEIINRYGLHWNLKNAISKEI